jgi:hypothetical protein
MRNIFMGDKRFFLVERVYFVMQSLYCNIDTIIGKLDAIIVFLLRVGNSANCIDFTMQHRIFFSPFFRNPQSALQFAVLLRSS